VLKKEGDVIIHAKEHESSFGLGDLLLAAVTGGVSLFLPDPKYEAEALSISTNTSAKGYGDTKAEAEMNAGKELAKELEKRRP